MTLFLDLKYSMPLSVEDCKKLNFNLFRGGHKKKASLTRRLSKIFSSL